MVTIITGAAVTVMVAETVRVLSATDFAVNVTVAGAGTLAGAVYVMATPEALEAAESVPQAAPLHPAPESDQVTPLFCASLETVAVKFCG
jgi:hypothetical protein